MHGSLELVLVLVGASLIFNLATVLQRRGRAALGFAGLLVVDLALVVVALSSGSRGIFAVMALGGFCALVLVPALLGIATRWYLGQGRYARAIRLLEVRQLLQPGLGLERERQMLAGLALVTQGRGEEAILVARRQLDEERDRGPLRRMLVERLLTLLTVERRYEEALELFVEEGGLELAAAAPGICVTMARCCGEMGEFELARRCLEVLERSPAARDPGLAPLVNGARISYLAHLGQVEALIPLLEAPHLLPGATAQRRRLWLGLALARDGRQEEAGQLWRAVVADEEADPQAAELARQRLLEEPFVAPRPLSDEDAEMATAAATRAGAHRALPKPDKALLWGAPLTMALLASIILIHAALALWGAGKVEPLDVWTLLRYGANVPLASLGSEPWRLLSSMFLHVGLLHLCTNALGLFVLGRFCEQLYGSWRMIAIYGVAGLAGAAMSATVSAGLLSVGASGAIFGLLGGALVGLGALRGQVPDSWRRRLMFNLLVVIGLQVLIGMRFAEIDNAAHFGGLGGGLLAALLLQPRRGGERALSPLSLQGWRQQLAALVSLLLAIAVAFTSSRVADGSVGQMLANLPTKQVSKLGYRLEVPRHWYVSDQRTGLALQDPFLGPPSTLQIAPPVALGPRGRAKPLWRLIDEDVKAQVGALERRRGVRDVRRVSPQPRLVGKEGLRVELRVLAGDQVQYIVIYAKRRGETLVFARATLPPPRRRAYLPILDAAVRSLWLAPAEGEGAGPGST